MFRRSVENELRLDDPVTGLQALLLVLVTKDESFRCK